MEHVKCKLTARFISIADMVLLSAQLSASIVVLAEFRKIKANEPYPLQSLVNATAFASAGKLKSELGRYMIHLVITNAVITLVQSVTAWLLYKSTILAKNEKEPMIAFGLTLLYIISSVFALVAYVIWSSIEQMWVIFSLVIIFRGGVLVIVCVYFWQIKKAFMSVRDELIAKGIIRSRGTRYCCKRQAST